MNDSRPLAPGDLCVILDSPHIPPRNRKYIGWHVILLGIVEPKPKHWYTEKFAPWWRVSRLPPHYLVSHKILQRLPPLPDQGLPMEVEWKEVA